MRLYQLLPLSRKVVLPQPIKQDMEEFFDRMSKEQPVNLKSLGKRIKHLMRCSPHCRKSMTLTRLYQLDELLWKEALQLLHQMADSTTARRLSNQGKSSHSFLLSCFGMLNRHHPSFDCCGSPEFSYQYTV